MTSSGAKLSSTFGPFDLLELIGQGGMAKVFKAKNRKTGAVVALKVGWKVSSSNPIMAKRFEYEFTIGNKLRHPHLVRTLDYGVEGATPYLVMELIDGPSLEKYIQHMGRLDEEEALNIILQVANALNYLHSKSLIHRDVKPANILLGPGGVAKLADLGLVKNPADNQGLTQANTRLGTILFAAPEQFDDAKNVDPRSDIYSLAATLYLALTGEFPFGRQGTLGILKRKVENGFAPPMDHVPHLHPAIDMAIRSALRSEIGLRPFSCKEFAKMMTGRKDFKLPKPVGEDPESSDESSDRTSTELPVAAAAQEKAKKDNKTSRRISKLVPVQKDDERRGMVRYQIELPSTCKPIHDTKAGWWKVAVQDISGGGVCLAANRRFEVGTILEMKLETKIPDQTLDAVMRVRWLKEQSPGVWWMGCAFIRPINTTELEQFLFEEEGGTDHGG